MLMSGNKCKLYMEVIPCKIQENKCIQISIQDKRVVVC